MNREEFQELRERLCDPQEVRRSYFERIARTRIPESELRLCESFDLSAFGKDYVRKLKTIRRTYAPEDYTLVYFQINPGKNWSAAFGILNAPLCRTEDIREWLFQEQQDVMECVGNREMSDIYFKSRNTPYDDAVLDYLLVLTLIELDAALTKCPLNNPVYAGVSRSELWMAVRERADS